MSETRHNDRIGAKMTNAQFRTIREFLGLTGDWTATHLGVSPRTVRHWESGRHPVPADVTLAMGILEARTALFVSEHVEELNSLPDPVMHVYRNDAEYHAACRASAFPASWHRAVAARVALGVPGLRIEYPSGPWDGV